ILLLDEFVGASRRGGLLSIGALALPLSFLPVLLHGEGSVVENHPPRQGPIGLRPNHRIRFWLTGHHFLHTSGEGKLFDDILNLGTTSEEKARPEEPHNPFPFHAITLSVAIVPTSRVHDKKNQGISSTKRSSRKAER